MKIKFKWERISNDTFRAKTIGGWIILSENSSQETGDIISSSMVFIPDFIHEWEIDD